MSLTDTLQGSTLSSNNNVGVATPDLKTTHEGDSVVKAEINLGKDETPKPRTHSRVSSDTSELVNRKSSPDVNMRQKQAIGMRASNLFYTPDKPSAQDKQSSPDATATNEKPLHSGSRLSNPDKPSINIDLPSPDQPKSKPNSSRHSLPPKISDIHPEKKIVVTPPPVAPKPTERRLPSSLNVEGVALTSPTGDKPPPRRESSKSLVRRTSSNDPVILRRSESKSAERASVISP